MQINERIKRVRKFRKMTQKELGVALGCSERSAIVRVGQYESGARMPKKESALELSKVLQCNYVNFYNGSDLGNANRIMMSFFWLEELVGDSDSMCVFQLHKYTDKEDSRIAYGLINDYHYNGVLPPVAIALNYNVINKFMREWALRFQELRNQEITHDEYFEWKLNCSFTSFTCDCG